jgi:hypothetical protein
VRRGSRDKAGARGFCADGGALFGGCGRLGGLACAGQGIGLGYHDCYTREPGGANSKDWNTSLVRVGCDLRGGCCLQ